MKRRKMKLRIIPDPTVGDLGVPKETQTGNAKTCSLIVPSRRIGQRIQTTISRLGHYLMKRNIRIRGHPSAR
jgi:hypothetical protein